jgi:glycerol-3-phosphate cytidylyltransferase
LVKKPFGAKMTIGITVGAYDLFHIGHLNLLRNAKQRCDHLIVGIAGSERIKAYKSKIPVFLDQERMEIVRACRYVDEVFLNNSNPTLASSYAELAQQYKADKWFVGSDWQGSAKWIEIGEKLQIANCELIYLSHTSGISTSDIIARILQR